MKSPLEELVAQVEAAHESHLLAQIAELLGLADDDDEDCPHGRPIRHCAKCTPKSKWPKGRKGCRCGEFIPKEWRLCPSCIDFESSDWFHKGHDRRFLMAHVCREVNRH